MPEKNRKKGIPWGASVRYNLARPGGLRRVLRIPHPIAFLSLCGEIDRNRKSIVCALDRSSISLSKPSEDEDEVRAIVPEHDRSALAEHRIRLRAEFPFFLRADIATFFPSIYTHSLAWAMHGKSDAKKRMHDNELIGNRLDRAVQAGQQGQTSGIPIGPDTSLLLSEILLSAVDEQLETDLGKLNGVRHFDDYELYFQSASEAQRSLAKLQQVLADFELSLNSEKTRVETLPQPIEHQWLIRLNQIHIGSSGAKQRAGLLALFNTAFDLAANRAHDNVIN